MSDVSARDLFFVLLCALVLARIVEMVLQATIFSVLRPQLQQKRQERAAAALADELASMDETRRSGRVDRSEVRHAADEQAYLDGWRACEACHRHREEPEDHVMHHYGWDGTAREHEKCAPRAGSGACNSIGPAGPPMACNHLHPSGAICSRLPGHLGPHRHGVDQWTDAVSDLGPSTDVDLRASLGASIDLPPMKPSKGRKP